MSTPTSADLGLHARRHRGPSARSRPISPRAQSSIDRAQCAGISAPARRQPGGTVCLATGDADGMMVSLYPVELFGLRLRRRGARHRHQPAEPRLRIHSDQAGIPTRSARASGRSRPSFPVSSCRTEEPLMAFGLMGGPMQAQGHLADDAAHAVWGQDPQTGSRCAALALWIEGLDVAHRKRDEPCRDGSRKARQRSATAAQRSRIPIRASASAAHSSYIASRAAMSAALTLRKDGHAAGF